MISACEFCSIVEDNIARKEAEKERIRKERERLIAEKGKNTLLFCENVLAPSFDKQVNKNLICKSVYLPLTIIIDKEDKDSFIYIIDEIVKPAGTTEYGNDLYTRKLISSSELYSISILKEYFKERGYKIIFHETQTITRWSTASKKLAYVNTIRIEITLNCDLA